MSAHQPGRTSVHRTMSQAAIVGTLLSLIGLVALAWPIGQPPATAYASGFPVCGKVTTEQTATRPPIHLNRSEGPIGTHLTVTATNWHPGVHVTLHVDGRASTTGDLSVLMPTFADGVIASDGTVTFTSLSAPAVVCTDMYAYPNARYRVGDPGTAAFFVLVADDGEVSAPVAFQYLAAPTISLSGGGHGVAVGSSLVVTGSGWEPQEAVTVRLTSTGISSHRETSGDLVHATADEHGTFQVHYPIAASWPWHSESQVDVVSSGPQFGTLTASAPLNLLPAIPPTFQVDHTLVTQGMTITVNGDHWYPGDTYTIKYCDAAWRDGVWADGPNCGKAVNPTLGTVTVDATGRMQQQFRIPKDQPTGTIMVRILELTTGPNVQPVAVQVVAHLPTWDDHHPRVAALRNTLVGWLPFTVPAALVVGVLAVAVGRRWYAMRRVG